MKENLLVAGFVLAGLFLVIWGAVTKDNGLIPIGIGLFTTVAGYLYGASKGETRAMLRIKQEEAAMNEARNTMFCQNVTPTDTDLR